MKEFFDTFVAYLYAIMKVAFEIMAPIILVGGIMAFSIRACHTTPTYQAVSDVIILETIQRR